MLSILNPIDMAMTMPCCPYAPYCSHSQRQIQPQGLQSHSLGSAGDNASWAGRLPPQQQSPYSYSRTSHTPLFPSQTLNYLNDQDKLRSSSSAYTTQPPTPSWTSSAYQMVGNDFGNPTWLSPRSKDNLPGPASNSYADNNDYMQGMKYESLGLRDVSPSRTTDFSTISASSQASPAPGATFMSYTSMRAAKDDSPYLSSQPLPPEHLRTAESDSRRMSVVSYDSDSISGHSKGRSRKEGEAIRCHICLKSFDRRSNFKSHWETHDKDRQRTVCKIDGCDKTFGRPAEMTRHVNSAHRQKSFPCSSCGKEFTRHDILLRHCKDACPVLVKGKGNGKKRRSKGS